MSFFGRRREDLIPVPPVVGPRAILDLNRFAELAVIAVVGIFFGTMWNGVNDSRTKLTTIESELKGIPTIRQDIKDIDSRLRDVEKKVK